MRIAHVIARLNDGGPARVLESLVLGLTAAGHTSVIFAGTTAADEDDLTPRLRAAGCTVVQVEGLGRQVHVRGDLRALGSVGAALRAWRPDIIHTHTAKAGVLGRLVARRLGLPMVHTFHGHVLRGYFSRGVSAAAVMAERWLARGCTLHALTPSQAQELHRHWHIGRPQRWRVVPVPVAPVAVAPHPARAVPVVGFLGRLVPIKDADVWLDTLRELQQRLPIRGIICGDGGERPRLQRRAGELGLDVTFTGFIPVAHALAQMDVLLLTSQNEGLPLAAVEAAGAGIPVVAPPVGGMRDLIAAGMIHGATRRPQALAAAVVQVLQHGADPRAQAAALALAPAVVLPSYVRLYEDVYRHHARSHGFRPQRGLGPERDSRA